MPITEHTINDALAALLRKTRRAWYAAGVVSSENTGILKLAAKRPDILVMEPNVSPVVIETEVMPAVHADDDAVSRLGDQVKSTGRAILSSIAVRLPARLRDKQPGASIDGELSAADDLDMAVYTGASPHQFSRWPQSGWIRGTVADLSLLTQWATVPPEVIDAAANELVEGVSDAAGYLEEMAAAHPGAIHKISEDLCQEDGEQTRRMATTILVNAFVFMESLAGGPGESAKIRSIAELQSAGELTKAGIVAEWRRILKVNYWPIFDIARRIFEHVPAQYCKPLIQRLAKTAERLLETSLMRSHDLTGAVFQRLIADRKFLAAYYTMPSSAALLAGLAINVDQTPSGGSWASVADVRGLRIADFACGTGTLLSTSYQRIGQLHELAGGDADALHADMMASGIVGCDVLPAAAHLTASMLAGAHPRTKYAQSSILTLAYGKQPDGTIRLGSLDLLDPQGKLEILEITAKAAEGMGEKERATWKALPHSSFDLVMMNPPFVRPTNHEADRLNVPNPMFAAFASSAEEQRLMSEVTKRLTKGTSAHGNAGEASIFLVLADSKLRAGGTLALVMPLSLLSGDSWERSRALLASKYRDLILVTIAGSTDREMSFSADTDMGECLVVAKTAVHPERRATFVVLRERPTFPLIGFSAAAQIRRLVASKKISRLEDGPVGGTPLYFGDDVVGQALDAPLPAKGGWNLARVADLSLAQAAYQLTTKKRIWLPTMSQSDAVSVPMTTVAKIGQIGPLDRDINGKNPTGDYRGPFDIRPLKPGSVPTYPAIWKHDAKRERTMAFAGECEATPRHAKTAADKAALAAKVTAVWNTASHCHFNRDFRFNSQSTGMQFTPKKTIGGRAWPSIRLSSVAHEKALVVFANTSLGLLARWWHSNRQQAGRGCIGKSMLHTLPVLDVQGLTPAQLAAAVSIFDALSKSEMLPMYRLDEDPIREELDRRFGLDVLGLPASLFEHGGAIELLRNKLAAEPSIRGAKSDAGNDEEEEDDDVGQEDEDEPEVV